MHENPRFTKKDMEKIIATYFVRNSGKRMTSLLVLKILEK